jgi:hypothetical protein
MRTELALALALCLLPHESFADVVRHEFVPILLRGSWAPRDGVCQKDNKSIITISEKAYASSNLTCTVAHVSETSEAGGEARYSAHLDCSKMIPPKQTDLILIPKKGDLISVGPSFESLRDYKHCASQ